MHRAPGSGDELEKWELDLLRAEARVFVRERQLRWSDEDDLWQEAAIAWLRQRRRWDPGRASAPTYLKRIARHAMEDVARQERAERRAGERTASSLQEPFGEDAGRTRADLLAGPGEVDDVEARVDTARVGARLTPRQRQVLRGLAAGYRVQDLASVLGVHRDTLHQDRRRIREAFAAEGLIVPD